MATFRTDIQVVCALFIILLIPTWGWCVPPGTTISNTARVTYDSGIVLISNTVTLVTEIIKTSSMLEYLKYAPAASGAELVTVPITEYSTSGTGTGPFVQLSPPTPIGSPMPIDLSNPVPLLPTSLLHQGEPVFLRLTDPDQNLYPLVAETVLVTVSVGPLGERELLRLKETGLNTGVFAGYIQSAGNPPPTPPQPRMTAFLPSLRSAMSFQTMWTWQTVATALLQMSWWTPSALYSAALSGWQLTGRASP